MTLKQRICDAGVDTLGEYMCLTLDGGVLSTVLVPYDDMLLDLQIDRMGIDFDNSVMSIEIQTKEIDAELGTKELSIDIDTNNKEIDNGCN